MKLFFNKRNIFQLSSRPQNLAESFDGDPGQKYQEVSRDYQSFNDQDLSSVRQQLSQYNSDWVDQLPAEDKAEASRQWAYCLAMELGIRRADEHRNDYGLGMKLAINSPKTNREYSGNQTRLKEVQAKLRLAIDSGNTTTKEKAEKFLAKIESHLQDMNPPAIERKEIRESFSVLDYMNIQITQNGWDVSAIEISVTSDEEMALGQAGQEGYYFMTSGPFDGRAGGELTLCQHGMPVSPSKKVMVPGLTRTIVGFPLDL
jgi:hypothetical protein